MTLAVILACSMVCASSALPSSGHIAPQSASATNPENAPTQNPPPQDQATAPAQNPPTSSPPPSSATPAQKSSGQVQTKTAPRNHHRKRALPPNCKPAPTPSPAGQPGSAATPSDPPATASAPTPCPPPKVIVRQGGASEPSIQLAGGTPGDQTSHTLDTAKRMLGSTEANLKKIAGRQLTPNQQEMVNQIHQFIDQSKTAVDAGDLDRARTLAWKAQLLSEELVKPEK
jgi:hypothetical protein